MAHITRKLGLSLGADICWPIAFKELLDRLSLAIPMKGDTISFEVERVRIEPFDLRRPCRYDLVIDRLAHWYYPTREWLKKIILLNDVYVLNNPWSFQSMEKHTTYCAVMRLGFPVPDTWLIPPKDNETSGDLDATLRQYASLFDLADIGKKLGYPLFLKPYDGGAWKGVSRIDDEQALFEAYDGSGTNVMHLQKAVDPFDEFVRCVGVGPQVRYVSYDPAAPLHDRYTMKSDFLKPNERELLRKMTLTINTFFGWDFNSCEAMRSNGKWYPIDFANACPDSQVTSLHYHFPWLVNANIRWAVFCAATERRMRNLNWTPYFKRAADGGTLEELLDDYVVLANKRLETDRFEEFCAEHLSHLDEVAHEFYGSELARDAVRQKVAAMFPEQEVEEFTELFWQRIQTWRSEETRRSSALTDKFDTKGRPLSSRAEGKRKDNH